MAAYAAKVDYVVEFILIVSLLCVSVHMVELLEKLSPCQKPVHMWMIVCYGLVCSSRLLHVVGTILSPVAGTFLLSLRPSGIKLQLLTINAWLINVPVYSAWTLWGSVLLFEAYRQSPTCVQSPAGFQATAIASSPFVWQALSYLWIGTHMRFAFMAWRLERGLQNSEAELRRLESPEVLARWGQVSSTLSLGGRPFNGLSASEITNLPCEEVQELAEGDELCAICVDAFNPGDSVRCLSACGHKFHKSCIDLWLLRQADCPLCKRGVAATSPACTSYYV